LLLGIAADEMIGKEEKRGGEVVKRQRLGTRMME
jgi:hypothetical protein